LPAHRIPQGSRHKAADRQSACNNTAKILCHSGRSCKCSYKADHCDHGMADEPQSIDTCNNIFHQPDIQTAKNQWNHITSSAHYEIITHSSAAKPCALSYPGKRRERYCNKLTAEQYSRYRCPQNYALFFFHDIIPFPPHLLNFHRIFLSECIITEKAGNITGL